MVIDVEGEDTQKKKFDFIDDYNAKAAVEQERQKRRQCFDDLSSGAREELILNFLKYHDVEPFGIPWQKFLEWPEPVQPCPYTAEQWKALIEFGVENGEELMEVFKAVGLRKIKDYPQVMIRNLGTDYADRLVAVSAPVIGMSAIMPDDSCVYYKCNFCNLRCSFTECEACGRKGNSNFTAKIDSKKATDKQIIVLQDGPLTLSCNISGKKDMMWRVKAGQKAYALGVLKFEQIYNKHMRKNEMHPYLDLLYVEPADNQEIEITKQDIAKFREMVQDPLFRQHLLESVAPHIKGNDDLKEVGIYVMASQKILRPNNGLLLGPPARGKTKILQWFQRLAVKGVLQSFGRVSVAGLTSATVTDEHTGQKINKPGLFASYDFVALNEMQSIQDKKDLKISLNDALDRKEITSAMVGGDYNIEARFALLADSNNYMGQWEYGVRLAENLKHLEPNVGPMLSRFDLIAVVAQKRTDEEDDEVSGAIFDSYEETDNAISRYIDDWQTEDGQPRYGFNTLRKFFHYVSLQPESKVDKELRQHFKDCCKLARKHDSEFLLDGRYEETVMRQTRVGGRLLLKERAGKEEMDEAFRLVNRSRNIIVETEIIGERDGNYMMGVPTKAAQRATLNKEQIFQTACEEVLKKNPGKEYFEIYQVVDYIRDDMGIPGWDRTKVESIIQSWCYTSGKLLVHGAEGSGRYKFNQRKLSGEEEK